jgi:hypothetical protein
VGVRLGRRGVVIRGYVDGLPFSTGDGGLWNGGMVGGDEIGALMFNWYLFLSSARDDVLFAN